MSYLYRNKKGFTITEFLVSLTIVTVILTVIISNQSTYSDGISLRNVVDEISQTISQAQAYSVGVKELAPGVNNFSASYGLSYTLLVAGSQYYYTGFADVNNNNIYDGGDYGSITNISRGNFIKTICIVRTSGADLCDVGRVDVGFSRPSTEARITFFNTSGQLYAPANVKGAKITLESPRGLNRSVTVYATGQISAQ